MPADRIIFLREDQYSKFDHARLGIDILEKRGFSVEFWDCSRIFRAQFQGSQRVSFAGEFSGLRCFEKMDLLLNDIAQLTAQDTLITVMSLNIKTWSALRYIARTKVSWGTIRLGALPISYDGRGFIPRLEKFIRRPVTAVNFLLQKIPPGRLGLRPLDFILQGGSTLFFGGLIRHKGADTKIINAHSSDYDLHLLEMSDSENERIFSSREVIFLDHGGPYHRDQQLFNIPFPCSIEEYFFNLNSFFQLVEKKFGCSVVVASHPRVDYKVKGNPFEGRKIIQGETHNLVRNSRFVLSFCSTAVSFAVIHKKPIVFLELTPGKRNIFDPLSRNIANKLGKSLIHMTDEDIDWDRELTINQNCYDQYLDAYIKKLGSPEKPCWDIFADYLSAKPC
jgi:hypothetical protein